MARVNPLYQSFNGGEFSPYLLARVGFDKYPSGLETCENLIPLVEGPVIRRPGTRFVAEVKDSTKKVRLQSFIFSTEQAYIIEFGNLYARFYRHQGQIQTSGVSAWATSTSYAVGALVTNSGTTYYCITAHTSGGTFAGDAAKWYAQTGTIYEIPLPYLEADLPLLSFTQSADVLYMFCPGYAPRTLTRTGHTAWIATTMSFTDGPWLDLNTTATTLTPSATTGSVTVTASATTGINSGSGFLTTDVGRLVRISNPASGEDWGYGTITARASTTSVTVSVTRDFKTTNATVTWKLGAWWNVDWPTCATFFKGRLWYAASTSKPQTLWASQVDDFTNMSPDSANSSAVWDGTVEDDDAITVTISADEVNAIRWLAPSKRLIVGTVGGEWAVEAEGVAPTPSDVSVSRHTKMGTANTDPVIAGNRILFLQRAKRKIIELGYSFEADSYVDADMTRLARHITVGGLTRLAYAAEPHKLIYGVRADGVMVAVSFNRQEDVVGWTRFVTSGTFEDVAVIPGAAGAGQTHSSEERDEVWVVVKRGTDRFIEFFERDYENGHSQEDAFYVDSGLTYDGAATSVVTGLGHLEGLTVSVFADGATHPNCTVASGEITLDYDASVVQAGLPYTHKLKVLRMEYGGQIGTAFGHPKRISGMGFLLYNAHSLKYGPNASELTEVDFREVSDLMDTAVPLFSGEYLVDFAGDWDTDSRIYLESNAPAPFTLLGLMPELVTNDI